MSSQAAPANATPAAALEAGPLPTAHTPLPTAEALDRLTTAARRGRLPGFHAGAPSASPAFTLTDFGTPFESVLEAAPTSTLDGTTFSFTLRMKTGLAWGFFATLVFTVWPGVWMTDSLLRTYFTSYDFRTWIWYLPLTAPFVPMAMWTAIKRSRRSARAEAKELIQKISSILNTPPGE